MNPNSKSAVKISVKAVKFRRHGSLYVHVIYCWFRSSSKIKTYQEEKNQAD